MLRRALLELGLVAAPATPRLRGEVRGATALVGLEGSCDLADLPPELERITLDGAALARVLARAERIASLSQLAARLAPNGTLAVTTRFAEGVPPWGRVFLDAPRALLSRWGLPEAGTRFPGAPRPAPIHVYYASTELGDEAWEAGLGELDHRAGTMTFVRSRPAAPRPFRSVREDLAIVAALARAEALRRGRPRDALAGARAVGARAESREPAERRRLHARIGWLDGFVPPGPNCFRRVLAETLLDRGAAKEPVILSLDVASTGHAHFPSDPQGAPKTYDVSFEV